ncbi:hypothetical protein HN933_00595 [Candidatus Woesearchaeota archaeon]|nr:hypothetical protein [Candidatus Woesearchaeota archaeon]
MHQLKMVRKSDKMRSKFIGLFVVFLFIISICSSFAFAENDNETKSSFQDYVSGFFDKIKSIFAKNVEKNTKEAVDETVDEVVDEQTSSTEESSKTSLLDKVMNLVKGGSFIYIIIGIAIFIILAKLISTASEMFGKLLLVVLIILLILALYRYLF